jgi:hypothetical protein
MIENVCIIYTLSMDLDQVTPFDSLNTEFDVSSITDLERFAKTYFKTELKEISEIYYSVILRTIKADNLDGLIVLIKAVNYYQHTWPNLDRIFKLTAEYGTLRMFIFGFKERLRGSIYFTYPDVIYDELLGLVNNNPNSEVKKFLIKLSTCVVDGQLPHYVREFFEQDFDSDDEELNQVIGGETVRNKFLRFYDLIENS